MPYISKFTNYDATKSTSQKIEYDKPNKKIRNRKMKTDTDMQTDKEITGVKPRKSNYAKEIVQNEPKKVKQLKMTTSLPDSQTKEKSKEKRRRNLHSSSDRLFALSLPKRVTIMQNYQYYQHLLPPKCINKFKEMMNTYSGNNLPICPAEYGTLE